jgi:DNA repair exonuclease SbcCD ATPase subunit
MRPDDFVTVCTHTTCYHVAGVDYTVWAWIEDQVLNEQNLMEGLQRKEQHTADERIRLEEQRAYFAQRLASIDTEIDRLKTLFTSGLFTLQEIARDKKRLDISRTEIEKQIAEVDGRLSSLGGSPDIAEKLLERVRALKQKTATLTDGGKREIIELLDTDVILYTKDQAP